MKKILTDGITGGIGQPVKSGTLEHLQNAYKELFDIAVKTIQGGEIADSVPRTLYGVGNNGSGANYDITAGAVLYNGQVYLVPATTFTAATGAVFVITTSYNTGATADPVTMTDGSFRNVHQNQIIEVVDGDSSTPGYIADFGDLVAFSFDWISKTMDAADTTQPAIFTSGVYFFKRQGNVLFLSFRATFSGSYSSSTNAIGIKIPYGYNGAFAQYHMGERHEVTAGTVDAAALRVQTSTSNLIYMFPLDNSNLPNPSTHPQMFTASLVIALA